MGSEGYLITQFLAAAHQPPHATTGAARSRTACASPPRSCAARARAAGRDFIIVYRISALDLVEGGLTAEEIVDARRRARGGRRRPSSTPASAGTRRASRPSRRRCRAALSPGRRGVSSRRCGSRWSPPTASTRPRWPRRSSRAATPTWCRSRARCSPTPSSPNKARAGDRAGINICIACNQACLDHYFIGQPASCVVNPRAGQRNEAASSARPRKKTRRGRRRRPGRPVLRRRSRPSAATR